MGLRSDLHDQELVAVKEGGSPEALRREAALLQELDHEGIIRFVALTSDERGLRLLTRYAGRETLATWQPQRIEDLRQVFEDLAEVVCYLHGEGIVHGAIHAGHVLIGARRRPLLCSLSAAQRVAGGAGGGQGGVGVGGDPAAGPGNDHSDIDAAAAKAADVAAVGTTMLAALDRLDAHKARAGRRREEQRVRDRLVAVAGAAAAGRVRTAGALAGQLQTLDSDAGQRVAADGGVGAGLSVGVAAGDVGGEHAPGGHPGFGAGEHPGYAAGEQAVAGGAAHDGTGTWPAPPPGAGSGAPGVASPVGPNAPGLPSGAPSVPPGGLPRGAPPGYPPPAYAPNAGGRPPARGSFGGAARGLRVAPQRGRFRRPRGRRSLLRTAAIVAGCVLGAFMILYLLGRGDDEPAVHLAPATGAGFGGGAELDVPAGAGGGSGVDSARSDRAASSAGGEPGDAGGTGPGADGDSTRSDGSNSGFSDGANSGAGGDSARSDGSGSRTPAAGDAAAPGAGRDASVGSDTPGSTPSAGAADAPDAGSCRPVASGFRDIDGDGCAEEIRTGVGYVSVDGVDYPVGEAGDQMAVGDWDCDGLATLALAQPGGRVFIFDSWPTVTPLTGELVAELPPPVLLQDIPRGACNQLAVHHGYGEETWYLPLPATR